MLVLTLHLLSFLLHVLRSLIPQTLRLILILGTFNHHNGFDVRCWFCLDPIALICFLDLSLFFV